MFEKIIFKCEEEKAEFEKYKRLKGIDLYFQIYNLLTGHRDCVSYYEFSSYIRYDKNLRDKLYIYMATLEEFLRAQLLEKFDVNIEKKRCGHIFNDLNNGLIPKGNEHSKLYYGFQPDFGDLMHICETKGIYIIDSNDQKSIKQLRNETMHHALIMFGSIKTEKDLGQHFVVLEKRLNAFSQALPKEYKIGFLSDIIKLNGTNKKYLNKYYLEVQNGRICVKR